MRCRWADCWCRRWPVSGRVIFSTGQAWTIEEISPGLFRYVYLPLEVRA